MVKTKLLMFLSKPMLPTAFPFNAQNSVILSVPVPRTSCLSLLLTKQVTSQQILSVLRSKYIQNFDFSTPPLQYEHLSLGLLQ